MKNLKGSCAQHCLITDVCRRGRGNAGAFDEAVARVRKVYEQCLDGWGDKQGVKYHLVLTVERPDTWEHDQ